MRLTGLAPRRVAVTIAATGMVLGALIWPSSAQAAPIPGDSAFATADRLGTSAYLDQATGSVVVNVTTEAEAKSVRAAGGTAKYVSRDARALASVTNALDRLARIPGTAWAVDPTTNQVVVSVDDTIGSAKLGRIESVLRQFGDAARVERMSGTLSTTITGGDAIYTGSARCSLGFNARNSAGTSFFVTAGHCTNIGATWYANSSRTTVLGNRVRSSFPGNDYGIVQYTNTTISKPGMVNLYNGSTQDITNSRNANVGETVRRSGSTTQVRSGRVTAVNSTVNYPQGTVTGLIRTTVCAQPGDSGGSLFAGTSALGITSGGSGNCTTGGTTFFQPVVEALNVLGLAVY